MLAFTSQPTEIPPTPLPVEGNVPDWLDGTFLRNVPAQLDVGGRRLAHWFDGLSTLDAFSFGDGAVSYTSRHLATRARAEADDGRLAFYDFASDPCVSTFRRVFGALLPGVQIASDNANVDITRMGDRFLAMTEGPLAVEFDPETLRTIGVVKLPEDAGSAHAHDGGGGEMLNAGVAFAPRPSVRVYGMRADGTRRRIASHQVRRPPYLHSYALTERLAIVVDQPFRFDPTALLLHGRPFIENYVWEPERPGRVLAFSRATGELVSDTVLDEPLFFFHTMNAFDDGDGFVLDLCAMDDPSIIDALRLARLDAGDFAIPRATPTRIEVRAGRATRRPLGAPGFELPTVHYQAHNGRPYRFAYGVGHAADDAIADELVKLDVGSGEAVRWAQDGCLPGEPVFVAAPSGTGEDEGVVLSVVLDERAGTSFLLVLDACSFSERGRAVAPHHIPLNFHGKFFGAPA